MSGNRSTTGETGTGNGQQAMNPSSRLYIAQQRQLAELARAVANDFATITRRNADNTVAMFQGIVAGVNEFEAAENAATERANQ